jgi:hypothetical protein
MHCDPQYQHVCCLLCRCYCTCSSCAICAATVWPQDIAVISPYRKQVQKIRTLLQSKGHSGVLVRRLRLQAKLQCHHG